jgi:hypothetical protein
MVVDLAEVNEICKAAVQPHPASGSNGKHVKRGSRDEAEF